LGAGKNAKKKKAEKIGITLDKWASVIKIAENYCKSLALVQ
jgi:hypothetical protein